MEKAPFLSSSVVTAFYLRTCYSEANSSDSPPGQTAISSSNSWAALKLSLKYRWSPVCWALPPSQAYPVISPLLPFCLRAKGCRVEGQAICKAWINISVNALEWLCYFLLKNQNTGESRVHWAYYMIGKWSYFITGGGGNGMQVSAGVLL